MFSGTLHVTHMTSSSTSLNDVRGVAARAAAAARARRQQRGEGERERRAARLMRTAPPAPRRVEERLVDLAARDGDDPALAVEHERLGQLRRAELRGELQLVVAQRRVAQAVLRGRTRASRRRSPCRSRRRTVPPAGARARWVRSRAGASRRHGSHQEAQKFRTTTRPRRSARIVRRPPSSGGSPTARPGASGRWPALDRAVQRGVVLPRDDAVGQEPDERRASTRATTGTAERFTAPSMVVRAARRAILRRPCGGSSVGRASASQAEGREFEPRPPLSGDNLRRREDPGKPLGSSR